MGSLTSRPKAVQQVATPQVVYVPSLPVAPAPSPTVPVIAPDSPTPEETRKKSLLARDRGRFGTILTGFKGLLDTITGQNTGRKTLLGE